MQLRSLCSLLLLALAPCLAKQPLPFVTLIGQTKHAKHGSVHVSGKDRSLLKKLSHSYARQIRHLHGVPINHIPHQIHLIWIGPKPFPQRSIPNVQSFKDHHPGWTVNFWTDSEDRPLPIPGIVRRLVTEEYFQPIMDLYAVSTNYAEKADLIRCVILQKEGGLYFDHDASCEKSFADLADHFDFVAACERLQFHDGMGSSIAPAIGLFLSRPGHPILQRFIELAHKRWNSTPIYPKGEEWRRVIYRTFDSFALAAREKSGSSGNRDLILPTAYFYANLAFKPSFVRILRRGGYVYSMHETAGSWRA